jgi:zinc protease
VKAEETKDLVVSLFGDWQVATDSAEKEIEEEILPPAMLTEEKTREIIRDKEQVHLVIGFLGTTLMNTDRFGLEVLDTILSGQSGRLFSELRDKQSLAYSLSSFSLFGLDTGAFGIYIGTSPEKKEQAITSVWHELNRIRETKVEENELNRAKNILISQYELAMQTHSAQALELGLNETYGLGQDFGNRYIEAIKEIDAAKVREMARKYILPDAYVLVAVGAGARETVIAPDESSMQPPVEQE